MEQRVRNSAFGGFNATEQKHRCVRSDLCVGQSIGLYERRDPDRLAEFTSGGQRLRR